MLENFQVTHISINVHISKYSLILLSDEATFNKIFFRLVDGGYKIEIKEEDQKRIETIEKDVFQLVYKDELKDGVWVCDLETNKCIDRKISSKIRKSFYYYERNNKDKDGQSFFSF